MRRRAPRQAAAFATVVAVIGIGLSLQAACNGGSRRTVLPATDESIATGAALFESNCQVCHGADGRGGPSAPDLTVHVPTRSDEFIYRRITDGFGTADDLTMPSFKDQLSAEQRAHLVNFVRATFGELTFNTPNES